ncbi:hypothetical protein TNCT_714231 [Trichonephila clavata]|uniref:Uncharacterized protein n=1 Tax=Trichonephila clavata TaxID=2740835 RepID=A0A8X6LJC0_TRICU|nr:hypothetical protein TNCT_714231 [Trichonephila clavata]
MFLTVHTIRVDEGRLPESLVIRSNKPKTKLRQEVVKVLPRERNEGFERKKISIFPPSEKEFENPQDCGTYTQIQKRTCRRGLRKNKAIREVPMVVSGLSGNRLVLRHL